MLNLIIRRAAQRDATTLSEMICANAEKTLAPHYTEKQWQIFKTYYSPEVLSEKIKTQDVFCAEKGGVIVGSIALDGDWVVGFYTHVAHLGRGVGTALMSHLETFALSKGLTQIQLAASPVGLEYYLNNGWIKVKELVVEHYGVGFDETLLVKKLEHPNRR